MSPSEFICQLAPFAQVEMAKTKIPASFIIAQGALESGWGTSKLARDAFNLFGVKASAAWKGKAITMPTDEYIDGTKVRQTADWRRYDDWGECIADHSKFFQENRRYRAAMALCDDVLAFTKAIHAAGYATDPRYSDKLISIIETHELRKYDV